MKRLTFPAGCIIFLCALFALWLVPARVVTKAAGINPLLPEPIKVTPLSIKSDPNRKGSVNDGWVTQPLVQVENTSGKAIKYLTVEVSFPGSDALKVPFVLGYGQAPGQKAASGSQAALQPGARVALSVRENGCGSIAARFLSKKISPPSGLSMTTRVSGVIFADETAWFDGLAHVPDKNNPLRWYVVGENPERAALNPAALFTAASLRAEVSRSHAQEGCYRRLGTEYVACCNGFTYPSAILYQSFGGLYEPFIITVQCENGDTCEYVKAVPCGSGGA